MGGAEEAEAGEAETPLEVGAAEVEAGVLAAEEAGAEATRPSLLTQVF